MTELVHIERRLHEDDLPGYVYSAENVENNWPHLQIPLGAVYDPLRQVYVAERVDLRPICDLLSEQGDG